MPRRMEQVEVKVTAEGMLDIVQEYAHSEDAVITISPQQVPALVEMLHDAASEGARVMQKRRLSPE